MIFNLGYTSSHSFRAWAIKLYGLNEFIFGGISFLFHLLSCTNVQNNNKKQNKWYELTNSSSMISTRLLLMISSVFRTLQQTRHTL